jgi:hypothetical protein
VKSFSTTCLLGLIALAAAAACSDGTVPPESRSVDPDASSDTVTNPLHGPDAQSAVEPSDSDAGTGAGFASGDISDAGVASPDDEPAGPTPGGDDNDTPAEHPDASAPQPDPPPVLTELGGLQFDTEPADQALDLFGVTGHKLWLEVSALQQQRMNEAAEGGQWYDMYDPAFSPTFVDHLVVQDAETLSVADYGKVEAWLVGSSTMRPWMSTTIPNVRLDANEFQDGLKIGTFEHIRLSNSVVGNIFREQLAHRVYRALDYPALRSNHVLLGSNVWGQDAWVPMTLLEVYKKRFCKDNADLIGGGESCPNMWEFAGDIGNGLDSLPEDSCQLSSCDDTRLADLASALETAPDGPGFKAALDPYISWSHFHQFQCLSWIMWTGDDMVHNLNNNVIIEREDGKLIWAPYSIDVSSGQAWHQNVPLTGMSSIPRGCQHDPQCWEDTLVACEILIDKFDALDPELLVDETLQRLESLDMLREGDAARATELRQWYVTRQENLAEELEHYRILQDSEGNCPDGMGPCSNGTCNVACLPPAP